MISGSQLHQVRILPLTLRVLSELLKPRGDMRRHAHTVPPAEASTRTAKSSIMPLDSDVNRGMILVRRVPSARCARFDS